ncbi:unnamed protein product [Adineta steineri]|uniref:Histone deacetylase 11 n=1 Tax=Adineta steineri TaxID=433720 RepID=A0A818VWI9_9BILA|nr:unnamed protein product [Adineta steineri]
MTSPSDDTLVQFPKNTLYRDIASHQWPIIYCKNYNIGFLRLEKLHPFDSSKWGSIINYLRNANMITDDTIIRPNEATKEHLRLVHTQRYLSSLRWSAQVARVLEVAPIAMLPNFIVQWRVLKPLRYQTGGTILAGKLALERGWAINIGGGFHHCSSDSGGGFCAYADLTLLIKNLFIYYSERIKKVLIVDLDAHQGNGHEHDFMNDERVFIMDMYNRQIYPRDQHAKTAIKCKIELMNHTDDKTYLRLLHINLEKSLKEFQPDFVVYNAGTDILEGDLLGNLDITPEGVIIRDEIVFSKCIRERNIPIVMCTSGGYQRTNARVIADSILNLNRKKLISCE